MKNIQVIHDVANCVYDIFAATEAEFSQIFPSGEDVAFIGEVCSRSDRTRLDKVFSSIWARRMRKRDVRGIHSLLFYDLDEKKKYYLTRRDEEAVNPDGTRLRAGAPPLTKTRQKSSGKSGI